VRSSVCSPETRMSCCWQTRVTCCVTANVLQTSKVDAQCDKLATELSWQCFASEVANFQLPHLHLTYPTCFGDDPIWVLSRFSAPENQSPWAIMWHYCRDTTFSHFSRTLTCDRQTDGQTDTRQQLIAACGTSKKIHQVKHINTESGLKISLLQLSRRFSQHTCL